MSLKRNPETEQSQTEKKTAYFSLEQLHREVERINRQKTSRSHTSETQEVQAMETKKTAAPIPELEQIETWAAELTQEIAETSEDSKRDERVMLLATAVIKMCRLLKNFSEVMTAEMAKTAERSLQNLNIQKQYAESVKASTDKVVRDIYSTIETEQNLTLTSLSNNANNISKFYSSKLEKASAKMEAVNNSSMELLAMLKKYNRRMTRLKSIWDFLSFFTPLLVIFDIVLRLLGIG